MARWFLFMLYIPLCVVFCMPPQIVSGILMNALGVLLGVTIGWDIRCVVENTNRLERRNGPR